MIKVKHLTMSNRIAVFNDGLVQQLSTPDILYEKPENSFVAQFIGENNRMTGTIKSMDNNYCSVDLDNGAGTVSKLSKVNVGEKLVIRHNYLLDLKEFH